MQKKLVYVVNVDWGFTNFRAPIALEAKKKGYEIHLITEVTKKYKSEEILKNLGIKVHHVKFMRGSENPFHLVKLLIKLIKIFKIIKPDIVHLVTIKAVLLGGIAARVRRVELIVLAVSGLGFTFIDISMVAQIRRFFLKYVYKFMLSSKRLKVIFQNNDDAKEILDFSKNKKIKYEIIPGSGVDLDRFSYLKENLEQTPRIIMISRLLVHKGVYEFVDAARNIMNEGFSADFHLIGDLDLENPASIPVDYLERIKKENLVKVRGHLDNIEQEIQNSNIVVLPSYREGFPKVLIEAASCGRAVITTDVPGCREAVQHGYNGLIVPPRDTKELTNSIKNLLTEIDGRARMGRKNRQIAESKYSLQKVIKTHMEIYQGM